MEPKDHLYETVLLVDDSPTVIKITTKMLKNEYRILSALDGSECIKITKKREFGKVYRERKT